MAKGGISGLAVTVAAVGGYLVYAGIKDVPLIEGLREVIAGKVPTGRPQTKTASFGSAVGSGAADMAGVMGSYALTGVQPHAQLALREIGGAFGIKTIGGYRASDLDHGRGLAGDVMTDNVTGSGINTPLNQRVAAYGYAHRERLGLTYIIADMQIASASKGWVWRPYKPITNTGDFRHVRHVHFSFKAVHTYRPRPTGGGPQAV